MYVAKCICPLPYKFTDSTEDGTAKKQLLFKINLLYLIS